MQWIAINWMILQLYFSHAHYRHRNMSNNDSRSHNIWYLSAKMNKTQLILSQTPTIMLYRHNLVTTRDTNSIEFLKLGGNIISWREENKILLVVHGASPAISVEGNFRRVGMSKPRLLLWLLRWLLLWLLLWRLIWLLQWLLLWLLLNYLAIDWGKIK